MAATERSSSVTEEHILRLLRRESGDMTCEELLLPNSATEESDEPGIVCSCFNDNSVKAALSNGVGIFLRTEGVGEFSISMRDGPFKQTALRFPILDFLRENKMTNYSSADSD